MKLSFLDLIVIAVYFTATLAIGYYSGRRSGSTGQYFLANKSFSGWAIGISFIGSIISSVTFIGIPADSFKTAWLRFIPNLALPLVALIAAWAFVPFFRRGTLTSAYEYLSRRFGGSISTYAAATFLLTQVVRTSVISYLLALLMVGITGWSFTLSLVIVVGVTTVYTVKGGIKAVIWTDVVQTFVLLLGVLACIGFIIHALPDGLATVFRDAYANHKLSVAHDFDSATKELVSVGVGFSLGEKTVLMLLVAGFVQYLSVQLDQSTVQRWCVATTAAEARRSVYVLGLGCIPVWALFQFLGTCLFVFYLHHPDSTSSAILAGTEKAESIVPYFISQNLPAGLRGMVIAGALAAAMSTLSACINSASMVIVDDFYRKLRNKEAEDGHYLKIAKWSSVLIALAMAAGAVGIYTTDTLTLTDLILTLTAVIASGVPGVFLAGMLTQRANIVGAWAGLCVSMVFVAWAKLSDAGMLPISFSLSVFAYYVAVIGNLISFSVAYLVSACAGKKRTPRDLTNLTVWSQSKTSLE